MAYGPILAYIADVRPKNCERLSVFIVLHNIYKCIQESLFIINLRYSNPKEYHFIHYLSFIADCGLPKLIHRAVLSEGDTVEGVIRTYTCIPNTVPEGETTIVCQNNGLWSLTDLYCRRAYRTITKLLIYF